MKNSTLALLALTTDANAIIDNNYSRPHDPSVSGCYGYYVNDCHSVVSHNFSCAEHYMPGTNTGYIVCKDDTTAYCQAGSYSCDTSICDGDEAPDKLCENIKLNDSCSNYYQPVNGFKDYLQPALLCKKAVNSSSHCESDIEGSCLIPNKPKISTHSIFQKTAESNQTSTSYIENPSFN